MKKIFFLLLMTISVATALQAEPPLQQTTSPNTEPHQIVRRAAFDIGSGKIKMQVSDVDLTVNKIANVLFADTASVPLREDLVKSLDGRLSPEIQDRTIEAIKELMKKAAPFQPQAYCAIATESLRLAKNGGALVARITQETGLPVTIVSQEEEGILGFISAVSETEIPLDKAVSWDFGGGSFQITTLCNDRYLVYQGRLGKVPLKNALLKIQGKTDQNISPNPISKVQAEQTIQFIKDNISDVPEELRQKLNQRDVVVLAVGINPLWTTEQSTDYNKARVLAEVKERLNLDDEAIRNKDSLLDPEDARYSTYIVSNLILAYGVMETLGIKNVHYVGTEGANAVGALLSPQYWRE